MVNKTLCSLALVITCLVLAGCAEGGADARLERQDGDRLPATMRVSSLPNLRMDGEQADSWLGTSVAPGGDVNGYGRPDLLMGAADAQDGAAGTMFAVVGARRVGALELAGPGRVLRIRGPRRDTMMTVGAAIGDVTGDGLDDIAVGAAGAGRGGTIYVVPGRRRGATIELRDVRDGLVRITGAGLCADLGYDVANVGDVNGDRIDDLGPALLGRARLGRAEEGAHTPTGSCLRAALAQLDRDAGR